MTNKLLFQVEKKGFPINIEEVESFLGTAPGELARLSNTQAEFEEQAEEPKQQPKQIKDTEQPEGEDAIKIIDLTKNLAKAEYDLLLGEGSFEKIYSVHRDVEQLIDLFDPTSFEVAEAIEKETSKRKDTLSKKKADLLKEKALKNKKKKQVIKCD